MISRIKEKAKDGYDWIDILEPKKEELNEVAEQYNLHYTLIKDSLQPEHLPKYEMVNQVQFIILRIYDNQSSLDSDTTQEITNKIAIFLGKDFIITVHRASSEFLQTIREKYLVTGLCTNQYELTYRIISGVFLSYDEPSNKLIQDLDFYESKIFLKEKTPSLLKNLYLIKRKAASINRVLGLSRSILDNLENKISSPSLQDLRDSMTRIKVNSEQTIENVSNLLNVYISLSSQKTNEVMRILTVFSVFFMPLTFIVGIYGMNFRFMPELDLHWGYPGVLILMAVVTMVIFYWFKRKKWL
jgi:magnesium transporter